MWSKSGKKITNEQLDTRLSLRYPNLKRESDYKDSKTRMLFSCTKCGKKFKKKPKEINKINCKCSIRENKYKEHLESKNIELLSDYVNAKSKTKHRCKTCSLEFITTPKSVLNSKIGCPSCSGKIFSTEKYKSLLPENIELISTEYVGSNYKHKHRCLECNSEFDTKPNYILHMDTNCPTCSKSKGERVVSDFLNSLELDYIQEYVVDIEGKNLRFDFYIKELNILIEYDGIQHTKPIDRFGGYEYFEKLKINDDLKNKWCLVNDYTLIRIPYNVDATRYLEYIFTK